MKLIDYWKKSDEDYLVKLLWNNQNRYSLPTYLEVKEFLKSQDASGFEFEGMNDLIINFDEEDKTFELELC